MIVGDKELSERFEVTYRRSHLNSAYYIVRLNGRAWRVVHESRLQEKIDEIGGEVIEE